MPSSYRIEFLPAAAKQFSALPRRDQRRLAHRIEALSHDPRPPGHVVLKGRREFFRIRSGVYRVVYRIEEDRLVVAVVRVAHHRAVYRNL